MTSQTTRRTPAADPGVAEVSAREATMRPDEPTYKATATDPKTGLAASGTAADPADAEIAARVAIAARVGCDLDCVDPIVTMEHNAGRHWIAITHPDGTWL